MLQWAPRSLFLWESLCLFQGAFNTGFLEDLKSAATLLTTGIPEGANTSVDPSDTS